MTPSHLFVTCASLLEPLLAEELRALIPEASVRIGHRGVYVSPWSWPTIYRINYLSRLASRVLLPLLHFRCADQQALYHHLSTIDWAPFFGVRTTFAIDANVHDNPHLRNSLFAAQVAKDAICDQLRHKRGARPSVNIESPDVQLNLFIDRQNGVLSFDTSGTPLHKRGYRRETVEATLQETLAAAILVLAQYRPQEILLDPCCGSGTLLIEAAMIGSNTPAGKFRTRWGFFAHPEFSQPTWHAVQQEELAKITPLPQHHLKGVEISRIGARAARLNAKTAGFERAIEIVEGDFRTITLDSTPTLLIADPPHGRRLDHAPQLVALYRSLGDTIKHKVAKGGKGFLFISDLSLAKEVGLAASRRYPLKTGGTECRLLEYMVY